MRRVAFLVDGFNVYHSLKEAQGTLGRPVKWLDLRALCQFYVHSSVFGRDAELQSVTYFSAFATFLTTPANPDIVDRHRAYVRALQATGVEVVLGRFKARSRSCPRCRHRYLGYEEKETDVAIAIRVMELASSARCETTVVVTGDTDIVPAVRAARHLAPGQQLWIASPFRRHNRELRQHATGGFKLRPDAYLRHQLPDPVLAADGTVVAKPATW